MNRKAKEMKPYLFTYLEEAKKFVEQEKPNGVICPCCQQYYKVWRRKPVSTAIASLINLVRKYKVAPRFYHLDEFFIVKKDRTFSQLELWGLIERQVNDDAAKRTSGCYRPTAKGETFVTDINYKIPKYIYTDQNKVIRIEEDLFINIIEALGLEFNYTELLEENY